MASNSIEKVTWLLLSIAVAGLSWIAIAGSYSIVSKALTSNQDMAFLAFALIIAWFSYFVMNIGWIFDRHISRFFTIGGTIAGLIAFSQFPLGAIWAFASIIFACYLVYFHEKRRA